VDPGAWTEQGGKTAHEPVLPGSKDDGNRIQCSSPDQAELLELAGSAM
jgi:hypothetical protein